jgi:3',5'-cyclic AMP phosphodiesterase CpdA
MTEPKPDSLAVANEKLLEMGKVRPPTVCEPGSEAGATKEAPAIDQTGLVAIEPEKGAGVASLPDVSPKPVPSDYVSAPDALHRIRREMTGIFQGAAARVDSGELKLIGWGLTQPRVQKLAAEHEDKPWFFVGDIHGDFLAWHRLFERVRQEKDFRLCFLGDLVDRGPLHIECFAALLEAVDQYPDRILWILGNHDEGIQFISKPEKHFQSSVEPAEFPDYLNTEHEGIDRQHLEAWGNLFIDVCRRLPRAVLFHDGLLATHGGVPLQDRWDTLKTMEAFHHQRSLGDFTWSRATSYPSKLGWKYDRARRATSSAFEFGYRDLEGFCRAVETVFPVKRVVRGHDHVENGFETPEKYKSIPLLTINGFGFNYLTNSVADYRLKLALGIGVPGDLPRVEPVSYLPEEYTDVYPLAIK